MTLNGAIAFILRLFSMALQADYVTVVEDRPIMFIKYCLPVPVDLEGSVVLLCVSN